MFKQIVGLLVLSVLAVVGMTYAHQALHLLVTGHDWVAETLTQVFSGGEAGNIARNLIALLVMPIVVALIPTLLYWAATRRWFPYFMNIIWVIWLVQTAALVILFKAAGG